MCRANRLFFLILDITKHYWTAMNNLNEFPLNFIRKDKTTVYWLIQHAIKEILEEDKEMAKEMAFELLKLSLELIEFTDPFFESNSDIDFTEKVDWIMDVFKDKLEKAQFLLDKGHEEHYAQMSIIGLPIKKITVSEQLSKIISLQSKPGFSTSDDGSINKSAIQFIVLLIGGYFFLTEFNKDPLKTVRIYIDAVSDKELGDSEDKDEKELNHERQKGIRHLSIYVNTRDAFPDSTKHFHFTLAGYIAAALGFLDNENQHNSSTRSASYREYLTNAVKSSVNRLTPS